MLQAVLFESYDQLNTIRAGINDQVHDVGSNRVYIILFLIYQEFENWRIEISEGENRDD